MICVLLTERLCLVFQFASYFHCLVDLLLQEIKGTPALDIKRCTGAMSSGSTVRDMNADEERAEPAGFMGFMGFSIVQPSSRINGFRGDM